MSKLGKFQEESGKLPLFQPRINKHFRIKSASKAKLKLGGSSLASKISRKNSPEQGKVTFSEPKVKKNEMYQSGLKIHIPRQQLQKRMTKNTPRKVVYECVKTQQERGYDSKNQILPLATLDQDQRIGQFSQRVKISESNSILNKNKIQYNKAVTESNRFKKDRQEQQGKGKYRCLVNPYIFDHGRKKSQIKNQQTIDQFWKNVNESLILADRQDEQVSKDLRDFVIENFPTQ